MGDKTLDKIYELKHNSFGNVKIVCRFGDVAYELILMTADCSSNKNLMELITKWRKENGRWFLSQFDVTTERTTRWFKEKVTEAPDRLFFLIKVGNEYIGHLGLFRFESDFKSCEIDNVIRGRPGYPGIMGDSVKNIMAWGKDALSLREYGLKVLLNNEVAIRFYKRLGFVEENRIPLVYQQGENGRELTEASLSDAENAVNFYVVMRLGKKYNNSENN